MQNIDMFDQYTAQILAQLYAAFPVKQPLDARKLCGHSAMYEYGAVLDDQGARSKHFEVARATIEWLAETGYLRGGQMDKFGLDRAVLTALGLNVLKALPESLRVGDTTGERLVRLVREGSFDIAKDLVKSALSTGAGMATKAVL